MRRCRAAVALAILGLALLAPMRVWASPVYNGGPVMAGPNNVYFIWYGDWTGNTATTILPNLISNMSGSSYTNILTSYNNSAGTFSNQVNLGGSFDISSSVNSSLFQGLSLDGTAGTTGATSIQSIVTAALGAGAFTGSNRANSIYDVLTAPGVSVSGFLTTFCGWHYSTNVGGTSLGTQYGLIGDPGTNAGCAAQTGSSPNNNVGADAMANVIAHEYFETVTDPLVNAWNDTVSPSGGSNTGGFENGDMCNFNFGTQFTTGNGSRANVTLNGTNYLLQQQWQNQGGGKNYAGGACVTALALANPQPAPEPWSAGLLAAGLAALGLIRRRAA